MKNTPVTEDEFINMMKLWVYKNGTFPLELITFILDANGRKFIAIPDYVDSGCALYLGGKSYSNYQTALTKVGALMDKVGYSHCINIYKCSHPLSYPAFFDGYSGQQECNPYENDSVSWREWESGKQFRLSEKANNG